MGLFVTKPVRGFQPKETKSLKLEKLAIKFSCSKFRYNTFQSVNNKGAAQTVQAGLPLCCLQTPKSGFLIMIINPRQVLIILNLQNKCLWKNRVPGTPVSGFKLFLVNHVQIINNKSIFL